MLVDDDKMEKLATLAAAAIVFDEEVQEHGYKSEEAIRVYVELGIAIDDYKQEVGRGN